MIPRFIDNVRGSAHVTNPLVFVGKPDHIKSLIEGHQPLIKGFEGNNDIDLYIIKVAEDQYESMFVDVHNKFGWGGLADETVGWYFVETTYEDVVEEIFTSTGLRPDEPKEQ